MKMMKKCETCGISVEKEARYCPECGTEFECGHKRPGELSGYEDDTNDTNDRNNRNEKAMAALAYIGCLVLIPMFMAKESRFVRYHVRQGMALLVTELIFYAGYCVISFMVLSISWKLYSVVRIIGTVRYLFPVLTVIGIMNVAGGKEKGLPIIGNIL